MGKLSKSCLLFTLNWLDAQLTLLWIRLGVATEGNSLMARILEHGDLTFLATNSPSAPSPLTFFTAARTSRSRNVVSALCLEFTLY